MDLNQLFAYPLDQWPFVFIALAIAFSFHEFAHAYFANLFGDRTAKDLGRVTLNPRVHLDILGTVLVFLLGFGWAKPVPVQRGNFKHPRLMGIVVSAVGPLSNLLLAVITLAIAVGLDLGNFQPFANGYTKAITVFLNIFLQLNLVLFIFNLIPLPPLDGYRIVEDLSPLRLRVKLQQNVQWGMFIFLLIVFIPPLKNVTIVPLMNMTFTMSNAIYNFFYSIAA